MSGDRHCLIGMTPEQIAEALGLKAFQGRQIFHWLHNKGVFDFDAMTNLAKPLRERLTTECAARDMRVAAVQASEHADAAKLLFDLRDGEKVESVLLRDGDRVTLCLSSQAGCPLNCAFCATGASGFRRNLDAGEIVGQALLLVPGDDEGGETGHDAARWTGEGLCPSPGLTPAKAEGPLQTNTWRCAPRAE